MKTLCKKCLTYDKSNPCCKVVVKKEKSKKKTKESKEAYETKSI